MLTLKDRNPSRNLTDDESYGVCLAEVESMCTAPRMLVHFYILCHCFSANPASRPILSSNHFMQEKKTGYIYSLVNFGCWTYCCQYRAPRRW